MQTYAAPARDAKKPSMPSNRSKPCQRAASKVTTNQPWGAIAANMARSSSGETLQSSNGLVIQRKMTLGNAGDKYEDEADRLALQIVNTINPYTRPIQPGAFEKATRDSEFIPQIQAIRPTLQLKRESTGAAIPVAMESAINQAKDGGQPLPPRLQRQLGQAMGVDFREVRVHTDARADGLNRSLNAQAFTTGNHIFVRGGSYQPQTHQGQQLLAHELTHVIQQSNLRKRQEVAKHTLNSFPQKSFAPVPLNFSSSSQERQIQRSPRDDAKALGKGGLKVLGGIIASPAVSAHEAFKRRDPSISWKERYKDKKIFGSKIRKYRYQKDASGTDIRSELKAAYGGKNYARLARTLHVLGELADTIFKWTGSLAALTSLLSIFIPAAAPVAAIATPIASWALVIKYGLSSVLQAWTANRANYLYTQLKNGNQFNRKLLYQYLYVLGEDKANKQGYGESLFQGVTAFFANTGFSSLAGQEGFIGSLAETVGLAKPQNVNVASISTSLGIDALFSAGEEAESSRWKYIKELIKGDSKELEAIEEGNLEKSVGVTNQNNINDIEDVLKLIPPPKHQNLSKKKAYVLNPLNWIIRGLKKLLNFAEVIRNSFRDGSEHREMAGTLKVGTTQDNQAGFGYRGVNFVKNQLGDKSNSGRKLLKGLGGGISAVIGGALGAGAGAIGGLFSGAVRGAKKGAGVFEQTNTFDNWDTLDIRERLELVGKGTGNLALGVLGGIAGAVGGSIGGLSLGAIGGAKGGYQAGQGTARAGQTVAEQTWQGLGTLAEKFKLDQINKVYGLGAIIQGLGNLTRGAIAVGTGGLGFISQATAAGISSGIGSTAGATKKVYGDRSRISHSGGAGPSRLVEMLEKAKGYIANAEKAVQELEASSPNP